MKYSFMRYSYGMLCILLFSGTVHPALGQFVFWIDANFSAPSIGRSDLGGGNAITMPLAPQSLPEGLALDATNNRVFFGELGWTNANVRRVDRDLTTLNSVIANGSAMRGIAVDQAGTKIYWTTSNLSTGSTVRSSNIDGTNEQTLYSFSSASGANLRGICISGPTLFWTDYGNGSIQTGDITGSSSPVPLVTGLSGPVGVAVANGYVYWTEATGNTIKRALIASPTVEPLVSGLSTPNHIAVDATGSKMYWTEIGIARLRKADLTGSNVQTLPVTAVHPNGIVATSLPLPVQLVSFTGMFINTTVHLSWRTVSEINNYGFYVERRANGAMEWTGLAGSFVAGHGTTNEPHSYGFVDSSAYGSSRFYRLRQVDLDGTTHFSDPILVGTPSSAREPGVVPVEFALQQNYPNPFNPSTGIQYDIPVETRVVLKLYNILGREVATLVDAAKPAGRYAVGWNAQGMASGIYFYRLEAGTFVQTKRMVLMR